MQLRSLSRFALGIGAAAALLAACGGSQPLAGAPGTLPGQRLRAGGVVPQRSHSAYCLTSPCIYLPILYKPVSIAIYTLDQRGVARPVDRIYGGKTGLSSPEAVSVDADHNVYVADVEGSYDSAIRVYAAGDYGNVPPVQTITGPDTHMGVATGVAVDSAGNIHVTNWFAGSPCTGSVTVYAAGANGDAAPIAEIKGSKTGLCDPGGIALDASGNSYVTSGQQYSSSVNIFAAGSTGNVRPVAAISGKRTQLYGPGGLTLDADNNVYVASDAGGLLLKFRAGAHGNAKPVQTIGGTLTKLQYTYGVAVDSSGKIYANNEVSTKMVLVFASDANGDVRPIRIIRRRRAGFERPTNIAIQ